MELDRYKPGYILYTDYHALMIGNRIKTHIIAGKSAQTGYREGVGVVSLTDTRRVVQVGSKNPCMQ